MNYPTPACRPISAVEASVIEACIRVSGRTTGAMLASIGALSVAGHCGCGCASIDFAVPGTEEAEAVLLVQATGKAPNGDDLMIGIWAQGGSVSGMEVFSFTGAHAPLPAVSSIMLWSGAEQAPPN